MILNQDDMHLWVAFTDEIQDPELLKAYDALLSPDERTRYERYRFEKDRKTHLISRALVRTTLSRYADMAPKAWQFTANAYGRPEIEPVEGVPPLRFNLSHTTGIVALAVARERAVGVDVETHDRVREIMDLSKRFFSADEFEALSRMSDLERNDAFYHFWTLKESFIKACGLGLSFPLDQFSFHFPAPDKLRISFAPGIDQDRNQWQFWLMTPTPRHSLAVSLAQAPQQIARMEIRKVVPLDNHQAFSCPMIARS